MNGIAQDPIDGVSLAYSFDDPNAPGRLLTQYFEIMGSRAIYHDGWMASAFGPRVPWVPGLPPGLREWTPDRDTWELYNLDEDWTQNNDLAATMPEKLAQLKELFAMEAARNKALPIGGGLFDSGLTSRDAHCTPVPRVDLLGRYHPHAGVLCAGARQQAEPRHDHWPTYRPTPMACSTSWGACAGGLTCFVEDGILCYEYNLFIVQRTKIRAREKLPTGKVTIDIETAYAELRPAGPLDVTITVNGKRFAEGRVPISAPLLFTANDCLDIGVALGSPVSLDYYDKAPFKFNGTIEQVTVKYMPFSKPAEAAAPPRAATQVAAGRPLRDMPAALQPSPIVVSFYDAISPSGTSARCSGDGLSRGRPGGVGFRTAPASH